MGQVSRRKWDRRVRRAQTGRTADRLAVIRMFIGARQFVSRFMRAEAQHGR